MEEPKIGISGKGLKMYTNNLILFFVYVSFNLVLQQDLDTFNKI